LISRTPLILFCLSLALSQKAPAQDLSRGIQADVPALLDTYKDLHEHPELSHHEERTSAILAKALRDAGYTVTERIGKYPDGSQGFGVVAVLKNGPGPTLLVRADMDALPIVEETGLPYASHVRT
jgi:metal-dependent amidase/aminoacylase/carboxypeptidase family protein